MEKLISYLKGKKTFILVTVGATVFAGARLGFISADLEAQIYVMLGFGSVATLRSALKNK